MYNYQHGPERARLHQPNNGRGIGAWAAKYNNKKQWLQIDLGAVSKLTGIATQGRHGSHQWVTSYYIQYSRDCQKFSKYRENGRTRVRRKYGVLALEYSWSPLIKIDPVPSLDLLQVSLARYFFRWRGRRIQISTSGSESFPVGKS